MKRLAIASAMAAMLGAATAANAQATYAGCGWGGPCYGYGSYPWQYGQTYRYSHPWHYGMTWGYPAWGPYHGYSWRGPSRRDRGYRYRRYDN